MTAPRSAFITGASGAIAQATAMLLARDGVRLCLTGTSRERLEATAAVIRDQVADVETLLCVGDTSDEAQVRDALRTAHDAFGPIDMIFTTVGGGGFKPFLMLTGDELESVLRLNLLSAFHAVRHGAPLMRRGGSIVCLSSNAATMPFAYLASYHIAKAALEALIRAAAEELGPAGIRVNGVRPGLTRSNATAPMFDTPDLLKVFGEQYPLGRFGEPEDVARMVRILLGPDSGWITGQSIAVDGGNELRRNPDVTAMVKGIFGDDAVEAARQGREIG